MQAYRNVCVLILIVAVSWQLVYAQPGADAFKEKRYLAAAAEFYKQKASGSGNGNLEQYYLAISYLEMGKICQEAFRLSGQRGAEYLGQIVSHNPAFGEAHYFHGLNLLGARQKEPAKRAFDQAIRNSQKPYRSYANIWKAMVTGQADGQSEIAEKLVAEAFLNGTFKNHSAAQSAISGAPRTAQDSVNTMILMAASGQHEELNRLLFQTNPSLKAFSRRENSSGGTNITFAFFHSPALHFLAQHFYRSAHLELLDLRKKISDNREKAAVNKALAETYAWLTPADGEAFFQSSDDPLTAVFYGAYLWKRNNRQRAQQIWEQQVASSDPRAAAKSGFWLASKLGQQQAGLRALRKAHNARQQQLKGRSDQEIAALLARTYVLQNQSAQAMAVLDDARIYGAANDPVFQLYYAEVAYRQGKNRFNDSLLALADVELRFRPAKQIHYLYQGLVANRIRSEGEVAR